MAVWMVAFAVCHVCRFGHFCALPHLVPRDAAKNRWARSLRIFAPLFFIGLTAYSVYNAYTPVVRHYEISIDKKLERPLRIGMASDLHTGIFGGRAPASTSSPI
jgi:predicted MPP superfamily phosphohydrolase